MKKVLIALLSLFMMTDCVNSNEMNVVYPVEMNNSGVYIENKEPPSGFYQNLAFVLNYYEESFEVIEGKVQVPLKLYNNKEELSNYTIKALDDEWLSMKQ